VVLENGDAWALYGQTSGSAFYGFVNGNIASSKGSISASAVKDFGTCPATAGTMSGTFDASAKIINAIVAFTNGIKVLLW